MKRAAGTVGVIGAGTMGSGIAQLAVTAGARTLLHDPDPGALAAGAGRVRGGLEKARSKGWSGADTLESAPDLTDLAGCDLVIEAAPESLELKRELFRALAEVVSDETVLATNTSSLSVTALAATTPGPQRVVGMHFFNPPPLMRLLEVVAGEESSERALDLARLTGEAMGKTVIDAADTPGFIVNRCNRPFSLEAMRLVAEGVATPEQVDRIVRLGGGFRMGPFELMDLVGIDVGLDVARSFYEQSFGEPRWRPSPLAARKVAAGHLGRKSGRGWYRYPDGRPTDPDPPAASGGDGLVVIAGESALAAELAHAALEAGWDVADPAGADGEVAHLIVDCGAAAGQPPLQGAPQVVLCDSAPLAALDPQGTAAGFFALPPLGRLVELTRSPTTSDVAASRAENFFGSLGMLAEWVSDAPGLALGRIVCSLVNEACFALGERVGTPGDIDAGMVLGLNHPRGPLEWADAIGAADVLAVLDGLHGELREERYRPAPSLVRAARTADTLSEAV